MNVSVPNTAILEGPHVNWRHIDGPLMTWAGSLHWLTLRERAAIFLRLRSVDQVARDRFPFLATARAKLSTAA